MELFTHMLSGLGGGLLGILLAHWIWELTHRD